MSVRYEKSRVLTKLAQFLEVLIWRAESKHLWCHDRPILRVLRLFAHVHELFDDRDVLYLFEHFMVLILIFP